MIGFVITEVCKRICILAMHQHNFMSDDGILNVCPLFQMVTAMTENEIGVAEEEVIGTETGNGLELVIGVNMLARRAKSITIIVRRRFLNGKNQRNG